MAISSLRGLRTARGMAQKNVARRMGVAQSRVSAIERSDMEAAQVQTIARYVTATGGHLRLIAQFDGWEIEIDWEGKK